MITERALKVKDLINDKPEEGLFAYNRLAMTSPEILELEKQKIFQKCWLYLGHESEVPKPGDFVRREIAGEPLFFVRSRQTGKINVFYNTCTHRGATICRQDTGTVRTLQCFYHAWTFNTDGELVGVPDEEGYGAWDKKKWGLKSPRVENYRGFLFGHLNPLPASRGACPRGLGLRKTAGASPAARPFMTYPAPSPASSPPRRHP